MALEIAEAHVAVTWAIAVRLVRLAQKTAGSGVLTPLPLEMHACLRKPVRPDGARSCSES